MTANLGTLDPLGAVTFSDLGPFNGGEADDIANTALPCIRRIQVHQRRRYHSRRRMDVALIAKLRIRMFFRSPLLWDSFEFIQ
jgi:hypothetical protein